jgi:hypothetical protein
MTLGVAEKVPLVCRIGMWHPYVMDHH